MGGLPTACRLADVLIHARQSAKRCDATPPRSGAQLPRAFCTSRGAPEASVPMSPAQLLLHGAARRDEPVPPRAWDS
eukprot:358361-Chlamydomonas_euryale.AAC.1